MRGEREREKEREGGRVSRREVYREGRFFKIVGGSGHLLDTVIEYACMTQQQQCNDCQFFA